MFLTYIIISISDKNKLVSVTKCLSNFIFKIVLMHGNDVFCLYRYKLDNYQHLVKKYFKGLKYIGFKVHFESVK